MKRFFLAALIGIASCVVAHSAPAQPRQNAVAKRLSVLDYYFLLPGVGTSGYPTRRERQQLLRPDPEVGPVIDLRHDYLSVQPDSAPREQIAVFRFNGADLVAQSAPDYRSDYNGFSFYRLVGGKLRDVTEQILPIELDPSKYLLELPRVGTTIRAFSFNLEKGSRKPVFNLQWRRGRFVVAKIKR